MSNLFVKNSFFKQNFQKSGSVVLSRSWQLKECPEKKIWSSYKSLSQTFPKIKIFKFFQIFST